MENWNWKRFVRCLRADVTINATVIMWTVVAFFVGQLLLAFLFVKNEWSVANREMFMSLSSSAVLALMSLTFYDMSNRSGVMRFVLRPGSVLEKIVARVLIVVGLRIAAYCTFYIIESVRLLIMGGNWMDIYGYDACSYQALVEESLTSHTILLEILTFGFCVGMSALYGVRGFVYCVLMLLIGAFAFGIVVGLRGKTELGVAGLLVDENMVSVSDTVVILCAMLPLSVQISRALSERINGVVSRIVSSVIYIAGALLSLLFYVKFSTTPYLELASDAYAIVMIAALSTGIFYTMKNKQLIR